MPIYEQGYRRYEARASLRDVRFWPITREALRALIQKRAFLGLLLVCFVPFVVRVVQIYIVTRFPEAGRVLPVDGRLFGEFLNQQIGLAILLTIFGGSGLVANDLRTGAILVYLSRPLTRRDYVLGKLGVLLAVNLAITLVPALLLYLTGLTLSPGNFLKWELLWIGPAVVLHAMVVSLVLSLLALAISSLSRSGRVAGLAFFGLLMVLEIVRGVLQAGFDFELAALLSLQADLRTLGVALFGLAVRRVEPIAWPEAALVLALVAGACLLILRSRVRAVEVVK
jgi:ABC-2 type transport system permease protein